ncbi:colorectal mutant cancer protein-like, partial [Polyodon spathula]|uniref:colorectal mutant cancer protein-like n=1 Tax=Polyodon spathula TaxID=7913 RepID=UPI001B7F0C10
VREGRNGSTWCAWGGVARRVVAEVDRHIEQLTTASEHCDLAIKTVEEIEGALGRDFYPSLAEERLRWEKELAGLREENESLTAMLCSKEEELNRTKATMNAIREERDRLRRRVSFFKVTAFSFLCLHCYQLVVCLDLLKGKKETKSSRQGCDKCRLQCNL